MTANASAATRSTPGSELQRSTASVIVEARDLDTDERSHMAFEIVAPCDAREKQASLVRAVKDVFPDAKQRSYANGVASFVGRQHLVIARLADRPRRATVKDNRRRSQETLFTG